ncbi:MAG: ADP-forming succinate--CoA ligase subunit beta [Alphaproteobacteria bacterium CG_4_10_14_0_8_um_filter_53_9]|nr:MAG: ADP-forming succinate--CoA ligase subunit beta [Alphaproteobacteria bacterium CG_4_10_14_0_8_um_filter_53_9]
MNLHEYQAKQLFTKYGVAIPAGIVANNGEEAAAAAKKIGTAVVVVKAQVHAGGRGKSGGVKVCKTPEEAKQVAESLIGTNLVTYQTDAKGQPVHKVYVEGGIDIARELYLALMLDRSTGQTVIMCSTEGGVEIEKVAHETPDRIFKEHIDPALGMQPYQARNLAFKLGLSGDEIKNATKFMLGLAKMYDECDASMIEINPLVVTKQGEVMALDGKVALDDNALFRHPDLAELNDFTQQDPREVEAHKWELNYVGLDGSIGCMVNGAGLAMATMDVIQHFGGKPANFLDVGGGATEERVTAAFKIIMSDPQVKGIMVNIFGGIMKCDIIANGVVAAARQLKLDVPLVVRLEGTNVDLGKKILAESGLPIESADDLADAAKKIIAATQKKAA